MKDRLIEKLKRCRQRQREKERANRPESAAYWEGQADAISNILLCYFEWDEESEG